ncbi:hypothetical protein ES703_37413 [subsurface metagenome]
MGVDSTEARRVKASTHSSPDCFIIGEGSFPKRIIAAESNIVHGAGACRWDFFWDSLGEGTQENINDSLGCFHISSCCCCGMLGIENRSLRNFNF